MTESRANVDQEFTVRLESSERTPLKLTVLNAEITPFINPSKVTERIPRTAIYRTVYLLLGCESQFRGKIRGAFNTAIHAFGKLVNRREQPF